jgi:arylsulfatase A-like enzyme
MPFMRQAAHSLSTARLQWSGCHPRGVYWFGMQSNRRHFLFGALAAPVLAATKKKQPQAQVERANIVLIVAQDLGAYMLGCYENSEVHTPNIDRLAQTGVRFAGSFSCSPVAVEQAAFTAAGYNCAHGASTAQATEFLDAQAPAKPFFLSVAWPSPLKIAASQKNIDLYASTGFESVGWEMAVANATHKEMLRDPQGNLRKYAAALTTLDEDLPPLLAKLRQRGVWDSTLVIFTSNNGYLLGRHGLWGDTTASDPANMYEEAVRTPLIWMWPSRFPPQTVRTDVVGSYDLMPTLCELAGVAAPGGGQSYLPYVYGRRLGKKQSWPDVAFGRVRETEMARENRYKLILRDQGKGPNELYDETADAREQVNQIESPKFVSMRERLTAELAAWRGQHPA